MKKTMFHFILMLLLLSFGVIGCSEDDDGDDNEMDTEVDDTEVMEYNITGNITVPDGYDATATGLMLAYYDSFPPPDGMPLATTSIEDPVIDLDTPYMLDTMMPEAGFTGEELADGDYYLSVVLYVEGGGTMIPVDGVDYAGGSPVKITVPMTEDVDLGDIELMLYEAAP